MGKINFKQVFKDVRTIASKHSPEILIGLGITGMFTGTILAVKETPRAMKLIEDAKELKRETTGDPEAELTKTEVVKAAWKPYVLPAVTMGVSTACIIGGTKESLERNATWATMYHMATKAAKEFEDRTIETVGEETVKEIRKKVDKEYIEQTPPPAKVQTSRMAALAEKDEILFCDKQFGQYFYSTTTLIDDAVNRINYEMLNSQYASLNDLYDELGIRRIDEGDLVGWNIGRHGLLEVSYNEYEPAPNGKLCYILRYTVWPERDYHKECL